MKSLKYLFLIVSLIFIFQPKLVFAHVLKTDGDIGAILHIDPDDDPIAGSLSTFFFEFKDRTDKFKPQDCDCNISIFEGGKDIYSQPLFQNNPSPSLDNASFSYTFPEKNVYQVTIYGKPKTPNEFQTFYLNYDIRVARTATPTNMPSAQSNTSSSISQYLIIALGIFIIGIILFLILKKKPKQ